MSSPAPATRNRPGRRLAIPPQHGAWAYLALPLLLGLALSGWTGVGVLFAVTWIVAYPVSYYAGRALTIRLRRRSWTRLARRERRDAVPWAIAAGLGAAVLVVLRPWLLVVGAMLGMLWLVGVRLALAGRERSFANDLLLVGQSLVALPLVWLLNDPAVTASSLGTGVVAIPGMVWLATAVCAVYFVGSVIHVKSLIREAADVRWRQANIAFQVAALAMGLLSPWLLVPFAAALLRSVGLRPGAKPALVGAYEVVISVLVLIFTLVATGAWG